MDRVDSMMMMAMRCVLLMMMWEKRNTVCVRDQSQDKNRGSSDTIRVRQ